MRIRCNKSTAVLMLMVTCLLMHVNAPNDTVPTSNCTVHNGGCQHLCQQETDNSSICHCYLGYRLHQDHAACIEIDMCFENGAQCDHRCDAFNGTSYNCSCFDGYELDTDKHACVEPAGYSRIVIRILLILMIIMFFCLIICGGGNKRRRKHNIKSGQENYRLTPPTQSLPVQQNNEDEAAMSLGIPKTGQIESTIFQGMESRNHPDTPLSVREAMVKRLSVQLANGITKSHKNNSPPKPSVKT